MGAMRSNFTRRGILAGGTVAAAATCLDVASAKAPLIGAQVPAVHRLRVGAFEATVVSDGPLSLGEPQDNVFGALSKQYFTKLLEEHYLAANTVELDQNVLVVNTGERLVLFDTGMGGLRMMGDTTGRLIANLRAAGIEAADIDAVALTHAHLDHLGGLVSGAGTPAFPNAQVYMARADFDFWTDEAKLASPLKDFVQIARDCLLPLRQRIVFINDGQEFLPGIQAIATPGHTVGHMSFVITSQGKTLVNLGDVAHHFVVSTEQPGAAFVYDTDGQQAVATRRRAFDMLASLRLQMVAYHFPWPGIGYIGRAGDAYRYHPAQLRTVL